MYELNYKKVEANTADNRLDAKINNIANLLFVHWDMTFGWNVLLKSNLVGLLMYKFSFFLLVMEYHQVNVMCTVRFKLLRRCQEYVPVLIYMERGFPDPIYTNGKNACS